ncbi:EAL domain-containing protein [Glaciecola sp. MH2013]|uniref:EAL domain-containing protein n=1 Tax=Glaciecola sp. MH2013 TaxID=2785524 RepID=UPI00189CF995|nr:EAL domain-containing protein [Glaciecola sp. MH2013]MBF7073200.1 EAL domain-containing protein [Glaciecola sp. MH2013]
MRIVLDNIPMRVFWKDTHSRFLGGNKTFLKDLNLSRVEDLMGKSDYDFTFDSEETKAFRRDDFEVMSSKQAKLGIEESQSIANAPNRWLRTNKVPIINDEGDAIGLVGTYEDISSEVEYRHQIEKQALLDPLTGLANRRSLQQTIDTFTGHFAGLLFIDLDYFKTVNDSLGHLVGDILLQEVAKRIQSIVQNSECKICRLGGDEFSIFVPLENEAQYKHSMSKLAKKVIQTLSENFFFEDNVINIGASIGLTLMKGDTFEYTEAFRQADMAMYVAKDKGKGGFEFYDADMHLAGERKNTLRKELVKGLENNEFHLVFQPQVNDENCVIGAEVLLRWNSKVLGIISPVEFIPVAEETGFIYLLGNWVFTKSLEYLAEIQRHTVICDEFKLAINVSSRQFRNPTMLTFFVNEVANRKLNAKNIQLEITESLLIDHQDTAVKTMLGLQSKGFSIAIDDFGTGYSSLAYIANLPIDKLKIDRSFVSNLHKNGVNRKLVDTIINMSQNLHMEVIAEGVETKDERATLLELGCTEYQGYLFGRPMSFQDFLSMLNS